MEREEAPPGFRHTVLALAEKDIMLTGSNLTRAVQLCLGVSGSGDPFADHNGTTARRLIETCPWWRVHDIAEAIYVEGKNKLKFLSKNEEYQDDLNTYCRQHGIGWRMVNGHWQVHASDEQSSMMAATRTTLETAGKHTTANELKQAVDDLSRRPHPDITGSIQHIGAAIE
jgi:AbiJ N-terminal domain 4